MKNKLEQLELERLAINYSSKKQIINKLHETGCYKTQGPRMPKLGKGLEMVKLLLSQTSQDMRKSLFPMFFPQFAENISGTKFSIRTTFGSNQAE